MTPIHMVEPSRRSRRTWQKYWMALIKKDYAEVYDEYAYQCDEDKLIKFECKAKRKGRDIWGSAEDAKPVDEVDLGEESTSDTIPAYTDTRKINCSQLYSKSGAMKWLEHGHVDLDMDKDRIPCESLPAI